MSLILNKLELDLSVNNKHHKVEIALNKVDIYLTLSFIQKSLELSLDLSSELVWYLHHYLEPRFYWYDFFL